MTRPAPNLAAGTPSGGRLGFIVLLVLATAIGPLALQIFLPALPAIQAEFGIKAATAQLALSLSTLAIAAATLVYGPLADRLGRRPVLLGGLAIYLLGSLWCVLAGSILSLILARIVQAAGGCAGLVLTRAIIRDLYEREEAATMIAYVTMAMVVAPMLAPALGGVLTDLAGWRSVFLFGSLAGLLVLGLVWRMLPETRRRDADLMRAGIASAFARLLRSPAFLGFALQAAFSMAVFFSFLAAAPYLMVTVLERPASQYGLLFILVSGAFMLGNFTTARLSRRVGVERMVVLGSAGTLLGTLILLGFVAAGMVSPLTLFLPTALGGFSQGLSMPNAQAAAISVDPQAAGAASGLAGCMQMLLAALAAQLVGSVQNGTAWPMAIGMSLCAALSLACGCLALLGGRARPG